MSGDREGKEKERVSEREKQEKMREEQRQRKKAKSLEAIKAEVEEWVGGLEKGKRRERESGMFFGQSRVSKSMRARKRKEATVEETLVEYILCTHACEVMTHDPRSE